MPGVKQPCPMVAACWSPAMPQDRGSAPPNSSGASCRNRRRNRAPPAAAQPARRTMSAQLRVPVAAAGCRTAACATRWSRRSRGRWPPVSRHSRNVSTVPKASLPCSAAARAPSTWSSSQAILVAEKYGSSSRPVLSATAFSWPAASQRRAGVRGAPVLPDDGVVDRLAGRAVPDDRGLALVGDADAGDVLGRDAGLRHGLAHGRDRRRPDFLRIVLDPARRGIDLPQFLLRGRDRREPGVEHDGARRGGALVDGEEMRHGGYSTRCRALMPCLRSAGPNPPTSLSADNPAPAVRNSSAWRLSARRACSACLRCLSSLPESQVRNRIPARAPRRSAAASSASRLRA